MQKALEDQKQAQLKEKVKDLSQTLSAKVEMNHYSKKATIIVKKKTQVKELIGAGLQRLNSEASYRSAVSPISVSGVKDTKLN